MRTLGRLFAPLVVLGLALAGCKREPDFDERYDAASKSIVDKAKAIDAQVSSTGAPSTAVQDDPSGT